MESLTQHLSRYVNIQTRDRVDPKSSVPLNHHLPAALLFLGEAGQSLAVSTLCFNPNASFKLAGRGRLGWNQLSSQEGNARRKNTLISI